MAYQFQQQQASGYALGVRTVGVRGPQPREIEDAVRFAKNKGGKTAFEIAEAACQTLQYMGVCPMKARAELAKYPLQ